MVCKVCGGNVVEQRSLVPANPWQPPVFGPASKEQYEEKTEFHYCQKCRIMYHIRV